MPNDKHDLAGEEYQYAEADFSEAPVEAGRTEQARTPEKANFFSWLLNKRLLIALGVVLAVFVVYQFLGGPAEKALQTEFTGVIPTAATIAPAVSDAQISRAAVDTEIAMAHEIGALKAAVAQGQADQRQLGTGLLRTREGLEALHKQLMVVKTTLDGLKALANNKDAAVKAAASKRAQHMRSGRSAPKVPQVVYHLKAVVPGRAWLVGSNQQTVTVKRGDELQGYGRIAAIDSELGTVTTTRGATIQYASTD